MAVRRKENGEAERNDKEQRSRGTEYLTFAAVHSQGTPRARFPH
jgi:hypothetical protein